MDRDKLAKLRKKSVEAKAQKHQEILDSNTSIKDAVLALHTAINEQEPYNDSKLVEQLAELKQSITFTDDVARLEKALKASSDKDKLDEVIKAVGSINNEDVVSAVNGLMAKLDDNTPSQSPDNYQPVRRVIKVGTRLIFDDTQTPVGMGGGGSRSSVQGTLVRDTADGKAIAVVNPDGSPIGGSPGGDVSVDNFPDDFPLPDSQITTLTPQTDALTDDELRANPLEVIQEVTNYTTRIAENSGDSNLTYIGNAVIGSSESASVWQIKRLDSSTGLVKLWRDGNNNFDNAWNTREAGSYS